MISGKASRNLSSSSMSPLLLSTSYKRASRVVILLSTVSFLDLWVWVETLDEEFIVNWLRSSEE